MNETINRMVSTLQELSAQIKAEVERAKSELAAINKDIEQGRIIQAELAEVRARFDRGSAALAELEAKIGKKQEEWGTLSGEVDQLRKRLSVAMAA